MPYRINIASPPTDALDRLVLLGALDVEPHGSGIAAIIPDSVAVDEIGRGLDLTNLKRAAAIGRDDGSVWLLSPRPVRVGNRILRLTESDVFGTGHHPTTAMCIETLAAELAIAVPDSILDVGTGSGVLALAALLLGVPRAVGLDVDVHSLKIAADNARLNRVKKRLQLIHGGPDAVDGIWPLVVANVLAAPLMEMAPALVRRVGNHGRLILSGIPASLELEVRQAYQRLGMNHIRTETRAGWTAIVIQSSW